MGAGGGEDGDRVFSILEQTGLRECAVSGIPARSSAECLSVGGCAAASVSLSSLVSLQRRKRRPCTVSRASRLIYDFL